MIDNMLCLCGSGMSQSDCCHLLHCGAKFAPTAEALMRSRYSAYVMKNESYLLETWDRNSRPTTIDFAREEDIEWRYLQIINIKKGGTKDRKGIVEFKAYYRQDGEEYAMNEVSRFVKKTGRWFYLDGIVKSVGKVEQPSHQGKNAPCSCGSGKKFKRCCGK